VSLSDENWMSHAQKRSHFSECLKPLKQIRFNSFLLCLQIQVPVMYVKQPFHVQQYFDRAAHHGVLAIGAWLHSSSTVQALTSPPMVHYGGSSCFRCSREFSSDGRPQLQEQGRNGRSDGGSVCATQTPRRRSAHNRAPHAATHNRTRCAAPRIPDSARGVPPLGGLTWVERGRGAACRAHAASDGVGRGRTDGRRVGR
jgi:hypothetical protein